MKLSTTTELRRLMSDCFFYSYIVVYPMGLPIKNDPYQGLIVPIENPTGSKKISYLDVVEIVASHFEIPKLNFVLDKGNGKSVDNLHAAIQEKTGTVLYAMPPNRHVSYDRVNPLPNQP